MTIGDRIKTVREHFGMTQEDFGATIGRVGSHVSKLERGLTEPSDELILSICRILDVSYEWMKYGQGKMLKMPVPRTDYMMLGERIRKVRLEQGLTQAEFASRIGSALGTVSNVELKKNTPSRRWVQRIADEFHVSLQWLLTGIDDGGQYIVEEKINKMVAYMRNNEIARIAVMEAINADDSGIWLRIEQLIRERKNEG